MSTGNLKRFTECTPSQVYFLVLSKLPIGHLIKKNDSSVFMTTVESVFFRGPMFLDNQHLDGSLWRNFVDNRFCCFTM